MRLMGWGGASRDENTFMGAEIDGIISDNIWIIIDEAITDADCQNRDKNSRNRGTMRNRS